MKRIILLILLVILVIIMGFFILRYMKSDQTQIAVREFSTLEYPDDPAHLSTFYGRYGQRKLLLKKKDETHFDFVFSSPLPRVAEISFKNVDLSLFIPTAPTWTKGDRDLEVISLVEREWNRQQVRFSPSEVEFEGGDGFESEQLISAELSRNCLNAGLWEVLLYTEEKGIKSIYYHGWFTFPLGHYKTLFEKLNGFSYWKDWYHLEHWFSPSGRKVALDKLRSVVDEYRVNATDWTHERVIAYGEQERKLRTLTAKEVIYWGDFPKQSECVRFATFVSPGLYKANKAWKNEFKRIATLNNLFVRTIRSPATNRDLTEFELEFEDSRILVSGIDLEHLPQLAIDRYPEAFYMPMGIAIGPFSQSYSSLQSNPPQESPYFSMMLDKNDRWLNHHKIAIDGTVIHRDLQDVNLIHIYLLSYERHTLVGHYTFRL